LALLRRGGRALLPERLSGLLGPYLRTARAVTDIAHPHLSTRGAADWNAMVQVRAHHSRDSPARSIQFPGSSLRHFRREHAAWCTTPVGSRSALHDSQPIALCVRSQAVVLGCAGLAQFLMDAYPEDLPHYDPQD
jgi:hypothetical protein